MEITHLLNGQNLHSHPFIFHLKNDFCYFHLDFEIVAVILKNSNRCKQNFQIQSLMVFQSKITKAFCILSIKINLLNVKICLKCSNQIKIVQLMFIFHQSTKRKLKSSNGFTYLWTWMNLLLKSDQLLSLALPVLAWKFKQLFKKKKPNIYLFGCMGTQMWPRIFHCSMGLVVSPNQGLNPHPLYCKADS